LPLHVIAFAAIAWGVVWTKKNTAEKSIPTNQALPHLRRDTAHADPLLPDRGAVHPIRHRSGVLFAVGIAFRKLGIFGLIEMVVFLAI